MIVEAAEAVPWTKPVDLPFDPKKPLPKLGGLFDGNFNVVLGDGSVRWINKTIHPDALKAFITPNGGEVIPFDFDRPSTRPSFKDGPPIDKFPFEKFPFEKKDFNFPIEKKFEEKPPFEKK
jgi:hypothetical protein